jgi:hypothetical protein
LNAATVFAMKRRWLLAALALAVLAGCGTTQLATQFESHATFDRTFNTAMSAMSDQKMIFSVQDRRQGVIVAELNGDFVQATVAPQHFEGTIRVNFSAVGNQHADAKLLERVVESFKQRTAGQAHILPPGTL